jgi:site-specific DNA recombinase
MNDLKAEFSKLATDGYLGPSDGEDAYAYLRASSERQVEEGSSFPRQLESVLKVAKRDNLRVPFDLIFFDDGFTGFEFEHRPALLRLRHEAKSKPAARHLIFEDIDRLSRNADWQQGFLLEEFARHQIQVHFYINPGSQLERYVRGYIAQEGMKKDIERMRMGNLYKAMDGKVTARRPRFGYLKTDRQDSQYILHPEESKVMRAVYEKLIYEGKTLGQIAKWMNDTGISTRFKTGFWTSSTLYQLVKSPVYKGEFYANHFLMVNTGEYKEDGRPKRMNIIRPKEEWIRVDVPAIVTPGEWDAAQEVLARNNKRSNRNGGKNEWLLQGFMRCEFCHDHFFVAYVSKNKKAHRRYYGCSSRYSEKARMLGTACMTPYVYAEEIERRVWEEIETIIYDPSVVLRRFDERANEEFRSSYQAHLDYIDRQFEALASEKEKFEAAYQRDIYTLDEFEVKMKDLRGKSKALEMSKSKVEAMLAESHSIEQKKEIVIKALSKIREQVDQARSEKRQPQEIPYELKRKILSTLVEVIWVNSKDRKFTIEGEIRGVFAFGEDEIRQGESPTSGGQNNGFGFTSSLKWQ